MKKRLLAGLACLGIVLSLFCAGTALAGDPAKASSTDAVAKAQKLVEKGNKLDDKGDAAGAVKAYAQAIKLDSKNFEAHFNLGFVQLKSGRNDEAEKSLTRAAALAPADAETRKLLGIAYIKQGKKAEAIEAWKKSLSLDAKQPDVEKFIQMNEEK